MMIPVEHASALAQLDRYGFALVTGAGRLRYVEVDDLLQRILLKAVVAQAVRGGHSPIGQPAEYGRPETTKEDLR